MIEARGLQVRLGDRAVVDGVDLLLRPGFTAVVGPNGAGKSTLLKALAGLLPAASGEVLLDGRLLAAWSARERAQRIAWLAQQADAGGDLSAREVVALGRLPHTGLLGTGTAADEAAIDAAMQATGCSDWRERTLPALSGGERQRVLLARALAVDAPVLLLDEPTTHLDPPHQVALVRLLQRLGRDHTVVAVLHDLPLAMQADRVVLLRAGRVAGDGGPRDPALQAAVEHVFDGAVQVRMLGSRVVVLPALADDGGGAS